MNKCTILYNIYDANINVYNFKDILSKPLFDFYPLRSKAEPRDIAVLVHVHRDILALGRLGILAHLRTVMVGGLGAHKDEHAFEE